MTVDELVKEVTDGVQDYIANEEGYDDNAQLVIDPKTFTVTVVDGDDELNEEFDHYDIMDLIEMDTDGNWKPNPEAIKGLAETYTL